MIEVIYLALMVLFMLRLSILFSIYVLNCCIVIVISKYVICTGHSMNMNKSKI
jgi:hypothetical protein